MEELTKETCIAGLRVVRGPGWGYDDQDGFAGNIGTIIGNPDKYGSVKVVWDPIAGKEPYKNSYPSTNGCLLIYEEPYVGLYPNPNRSLIGKQIKILDNQGQTLLLVDKIYKVSDFQNQFKVPSLLIELTDPPRTIEFACGGNRENHYFELIGGDVIKQKPVQADRAYSEKILNPPKGFAQSTRGKYSFTVPSNQASDLVQQVEQSHTLMNDTMIEIQKLHEQGIISNLEKQSRRRIIEKENRDRIRAIYNKRDKESKKDLNNKPQEDTTDKKPNYIEPLPFPTNHNSVWRTTEKIYAQFYSPKED